MLNSALDSFRIGLPEHLADGKFFPTHTVVHRRKTE
jgi:hypothetical protein